MVEEGPPVRSRRGVGAALLIAAGLLALFVLIGGEDEYEITAEFTNASALVPGNQVVIGGRPVGSVSEIRLAPNGNAMVTFSVDGEAAPLRRGTTATVRWASLSSVANRQIQLTPPAIGQTGEEIPDGGTLSDVETIADVEVDQFFNMLDEETVEDLQRVIEGFATAYEGAGEGANEGFKYFNPLLYNSRRVFAELNADEQALERLLVDGSRFAGALADRSTDVSLMVHNLNLMMNAIGDRKLELARAIGLFPDFMRNANTTFVNLRAALDDLQPLVVASRPAAEELLPYLVQLRATARNAVPTVRDLSALIRHPGRFNDLVELQELQPALRDVAVGSGSPDCGPGPDNVEDLQIPADGDFSQGSFGEAVCSLTNGERNLEFFRAYGTELVSWFDNFSHSGYSDALGGVGRVGTTFNTYSPTLSLFPDLSDPDSPAEQFSALSTGNVRRCPGSNERPLGPGYPPDPSTPFVDGGALTDGVAGECDPTKVQPGK